MPDATLPAAEQLAARRKPRFANESADYAEARRALLAEEIAVRRHLGALARQLRALPPGPAIEGDYLFHDGNGSAVKLAEMFGEHDTLVLYHWMYGPERERPCPMCTSLLSAWNGEARDVSQRIALAVVARSPIERLVQFKRERGWKDLTLLSDASGEYTRDYVSSDPNADIPAFNVFSRRDGTIRHFWSGEMDGATADPGQDPRGAPDLMPLWTILDTTPEGRGTDWYPKLEYPS